MKTFFKIFFLLTSLLTSLTFAFTQQKPSDIHLVSLMKSVEKNTTIDLGLYITVEKGWHTYWENPGDISQPMKVQWDLPNSIQVKSFKWPRPERIQQGKWIQFGYKKNVLITNKLVIPPNYNQKTLPIRAHVIWLVCSNVCIPMEKKVELILPLAKKGRVNTANRKLFLDNKKRLPQFSNITGVFKDNTITLTSPKAFTLIDFFPINLSTTEIPKITKSGPRSYTLEFSKNLPNLNQLSSLVVFRSNNKIQSSKTFIFKEKKSFWALPLFLLFAFIGGLILNLMPCVLPVVFLKFYHITHSRKLIFSSLMYSLGVILSFLALALLVTFLKVGSQNLGWGFQMQSPLFVVFMILFFTFIGFSFLDLFYIPKPLNFFKWDSKSWSGGLISGFFATLAATPCTAPFMGAAIGFAFSQSTLEIMFIFTALGLGMSSPYIFLSFYPKILKSLPRPGKWNKNFKHILALPMFATTIWLIYILAHLNTAWVFPILIAILIYGFSFFVLKNKIYPRKYARILLTSALFFTFYPYIFFDSSSHTLVKSTKGWEEFSPFKLDQLRMENEPVLVNITAQWCITCQVNDFTTFKNKKVINFLKDNKITTLQGDWTSRDEEILRFLKRYQRAGIPFTIFYPTDKQKPVILPELLTPQVFIDKIQPYLN